MWNRIRVLTIAALLLGVQASHKTPPPYPAPHALAAPASAPIVVAGDYADPSSIVFRPFDASHVVHPGDTFQYRVTNDVPVTITLDSRLAWYTTWGDCATEGQVIRCPANAAEPYAFVAVRAGVGTGPIVTTVNGAEHRLRYEAPSVWLPFVWK